MSRIVKAVSVAALLAASSLALAVPVTPLSYSMQNGGTGSYNYWDDSYSGSGSTTTNYAALSGGLGDLTDGVIATQNWNVAEAPAGAGPYVGWLASPSINFHFASAQTIKSLTVHYDDANGYGGVWTPNSISLWDDAVSLGSMFLADPVSAAPGSFTWNFGGSGLSVTTLQMDIGRRNGGWVFLSEVSFDDGQAVPEPAGMALVGAGLASLAFLRRRKDAVARR